MRRHALISYQIEVLASGEILILLQDDFREGRLFSLGFYADYQLDIYFVLEAFFFNLQFFTNVSNSFNFVTGRLSVLDTVFTFTPKKVIDWVGGSIFLRLGLQLGPDIGGHCRPRAGHL